MSKAEYIDINGVARKIKGKYIGIGGVAHKVKKEYIGVGGVARQCFQGGTPLGTLPVGSVVQIRENGVLTDYLVVHQGIPDATLYDASCYGTWLLRKYLSETIRWHSSETNNYENSTVHAFLNGTFLYRFGMNVQNSIKQIKIPYRPGPGTSYIVSSGNNGLLCRAFLLSTKEVGMAQNVNYPDDGTQLNYFISTESRIAYTDWSGYGGGAAWDWWLRSPSTSRSEKAIVASSIGGWNSYDADSGQGFRPCIIFPQEVTAETLLT